jgi:hypothetical protein
MANKAFERTGEPAAQGKRYQLTIAFSDMISDVKT